jgi:hypothetical protein
VLDIKASASSAAAGSSVSGVLDHKLPLIVHPYLAQPNATSTVSFEVTPPAKLLIGVETNPGPCQLCACHMYLHEVVKANDRGLCVTYGCGHPAGSHSRAPHAVPVVIAPPPQARVMAIQIWSIVEYARGKFRTALVVGDSYEALDAAVRKAFALELEGACEGSASLYYVFDSTDVDGTRRWVDTQCELDAYRDFLRTTRRDTMTHLYLHIGVEMRTAAASAASALATSDEHNSAPPKPSGCTMSIDSCTKCPCLMYIEKVFAHYPDGRCGCGHQAGSHSRAPHPVAVAVVAAPRARAQRLVQVQVWNIVADRAEENQLLTVVDGSYAALDTSVREAFAERLIPAFAGLFSLYYFIDVCDGTRQEVDSQCELDAYREFLRKPGRQTMTHLYLHIAVEMRAAAAAEVDSVLASLVDQGEFDEYL